MASANSGHTIIPQTPYTCQGSFDPLPTIRFEEFGAEGVQLSHALLNQLDGLKGAHIAPKLTDTAQKVTVRINWPGQLPWSDVMHVYNHSCESQPVTKRKLVQLLAKKVKLCIDDLSHHPERSDLKDFPWSLRNIEIDNIMIVGLTHVSKGSWQPILSYKRTNSYGSSSRNQSQ